MESVWNSNVEVARGIDEGNIWWWADSSNGPLEILRMHLTVFSMTACFSLDRFDVWAWGRVRRVRFTHCCFAKWGWGNKRGEGVEDEWIQGGYCNEWSYSFRWRVRKTRHQGAEAEWKDDRTCGLVVILGWKDCWCWMLEKVSWKDESSSQRTGPLALSTGRSCACC